MKGKAKADGKFAMDVRELPPGQRRDKVARAEIAARKRVAQARLVLEREEAALSARQGRVEAAREELEAAEAA